MKNLFYTLDLVFVETLTYYLNRKDSISWHETNHYNSFSNELDVGI